jgi:ATP-dependent DNA ligase
VAKFHSSLELGQQRDLQKNDVCKEKGEVTTQLFCNKLGITLIVVPYWWDRKFDSLQATIYSQRPDLFTEKPKGTAIPQSPAGETLRSQSKRINYTVIILTPTGDKNLMTATEWDNESMDPTGWYMTEKYDGMRLYWNGKEFYSRQGRKIKAPESLRKKLPKTCLDGELWTQYGLYQAAAALSVNSTEAKWKDAVFWVFDAPDIADKPYEVSIYLL